jgi:osmotically-inducible protein OsmY
VRDGRVVGIVSRADLVRALAVRPAESRPAVAADDRAIREQVVAALRTQPWWIGAYRNVVVADGVVHLWGLARSQAERDAMRVAAETVPGVRGVEDHLMDWRAWSSAE